MGNDENSVVIELDSAPATLNPLTSGDYSERCVVSALYSPVLQLSSASPQHDHFEFVVADDSRFSDGVTVRAVHVLKTLIESASSPLWARHIRYLEKAEAAGDRISLTMRRPANFYSDMLQVVDFAPTHPDGQLGNGPYRVGDRFDVECGYYHLTPNPYFPGASERPELIFRVQADVDGAPDRFRRGEADITCSTAFPLRRLREWRDNAALHTAPSGIYMQLEPNLADDGPLTDPLVRIAMLECLDLAGIARSFAGGLRPAVRGSTAQRLQCGKVMPSRIRVCYNDFYPNREVLEKLSLQWHQRLGIRTELVERDYSDLSRDDVDAIFALRYAAFTHPYAFFDQCATLMSDPAFDRLLQRFAAGEQGSSDAIERHLHTTVPVLRLFEVIGHWLANPRVVGFRWPSDSAFDFTQLRCLDGCPS
jgi:peptide/nickel transport system substrate-binding protein